MGAGHSGSQDDRGCPRNTPPRARRLRGRRAGTRPGNRSGMDDFRNRRGRPTGAELAGALAEISRRVLARDFRRIDPKRARIILVEGTSRLLAALTPESSTSAQRQLKHLGVEVMTSTMVTGIDDRGVMHVGSRIHAHRDLGRRRGSVSSRTIARRSARPRRPRHRKARSFGTGNARGFRHWGLSLDSQIGWQTGSRPGSRCYAGRTACRPECDARGSGTAAESFSLHRQRHAGDDRPRRCRRGDWAAQAERFSRLDGLAVHPYFLPDRLSQPLHGSRRMGVCISAQ
jgi:hypothetical protein